MSDRTYPLARESAITTISDLLATLNASGISAKVLDSGELELSTSSKAHAGLATISLKVTAVALDQAGVKLAHSFK